MYLTQINILKLNQIILDQLPIWMVSNYFQILINYYWKSAANCVQRDQMNIIYQRWDFALDHRSQIADKTNSLRYQHYWAGQDRHSCRNNSGNFDKISSLVLQGTVREAYSLKKYSYISDLLISPLHPRTAVRV